MDPANVIANIKEMLRNWGGESGDKFIGLVRNSTDALREPHVDTEEKAAS